MTRSWTIAAAAGIFILGYLAGTIRNAPQIPAGQSEAPARVRPIEAMASPATSTRQRSRSADRMIEGHGTPFAPGQSLEWMYDRAADASWEDDPASYLRMLQEITKLDSKAADELAETLRKLIHLDATDPKTKAVFKGVSLERMFAATIFRLSQIDAEAAFRALQESPHLSPRERASLEQVVRSNQTLGDPAGAIRGLSGLQGEDLRHAIEPILGTLSGKDPEAALRLLEDHPQPELDGERRKMVERMARRDPAKAVGLALGYVRAGRNPDVIRAAVETWMEIDATAALQWANAYTGAGEPELKEFLRKKQAGER